MFVQIWIGADDKLPRMVRAVYRNDPAQLRHQVEFSDWQLDARRRGGRLRVVERRQRDAHPVRPPGPELPPGLKPPAKGRPPSKSKAAKTTVRRDSAS